MARRSSLPRSIVVLLNTIEDSLGEDAAESPNPLDAIESCRVLAEARRALEVLNTRDAREVVTRLHALCGQVQDVYLGVSVDAELERELEDAPEQPPLPFGTAEAPTP